MKKFKQLGLIGCGMMGGSFALALKRAGLVDRVVGYSKTPNSAEKAKELGIVDEMSATILPLAMQSDLILIAAPVSAFDEIFRSLEFGLSNEVLLLDVGSTKQNVIQAAIKTFGILPPFFVPSHPIAGKERAGIDEAEVDLYQGKRVILTPTQATNPESIALATEVWRTVGMTASTMTAQAHDRVFAAVSHTPHLLAFAYMHGLAAQPNAKQLLQMAGPGFRDFSRIAASDPDIWTAIFMANREEILKQSIAMRASLAHMEAAMQNEQSTSLRTLIQTASAARGDWEINNTEPAGDV